MPVVTTRPNATIQLGSGWSVVGAANAHTATSDETDSTYVQSTVRCRLDSQVLKLALGDISIPAGSKIFSVRIRIRTERVTGVSIQPLCIFIFVAHIIQAAFTLNITRLVKLALSFLVPRTTTSGWTTNDQPALLQHPDGSEWTQTSFNDHEFHVGRETLGGPLRISAVYADVTYNERPVGTASAPTGTVADTTRPLVTWTYSDAESDRQQAYQVRIFTAAQYGAGGFDPLVSVAHTESGWLPGEDLSWTVDRDLINGAYRAYVQVQQVWEGLGQHTSAATFVGWTQNVPGPGAPTLNGTYETDLNRVRLNIAAGPAPATETYDVEYSDDLGLTWTFVRGGRQIVPDGSGNAVLHDHEARLNRTRRYRVLAFRTLGSVKVASLYSNLVDVVPASFRFWLKDPVAPSLNMPLPLENDEYSQPRSEGTFRPLVAEGRTATAIVVTGPLGGREGQWSLIFTPKLGGQTTWDKFAAIRLSGRVLLWQLPTGEQYYVKLVGELPTRWDVRWDQARWRRAEIGYVETDPPAEADA